MGRSGPPARSDRQEPAERRRPPWKDVAPARDRGGAAASAGRGSREHVAEARRHGATLTGWRDAFLVADLASLATRLKDSEELDRERLKAKLGDVLLKSGLLGAKGAALEEGRPLTRQRPRS